MVNITIDNQLCVEKTTIKTEKYRNNQTIWFKMYSLYESCKSSRALLYLVDLLLICIRIQEPLSLILNPD